MKIERVEILEVPFDNLTLKSATDLIMDRIASKSSATPLFIATPNPEMLLSARKNPEFLKILQNTDLNIPDGTGIVLASRIIKKPLQQRVTGTDLMQSICAALGPNLRIYLLGAREGVAEKVKEILHSRYKNNIVGYYAGSPNPSEEESIRQNINATKPDLLFVAFGAPKQEMWLARNLQKLDSVKAAMGVGGAFNFIAHVRKRAPNWMRRAGIEWLFRVLQEPKRIGRIINATIVFPIVFLYSLLRKKK